MTRTLTSIAALALLLATATACSSDADSSSATTIDATTPEATIEPAPATAPETTAADEPAGWTEPGFDDSAWVAATAYTEEQVGVKDGYLDIDWDPAATLIWTSDLQADNTILWRTTVTAP